MRWSLAKVNSAGTAWAISNRQCLATSPIFPFNISLGLYSRGKSSRANEKDIFSRDWTTSEKEIHGIVLLVTAIISLPSLRIGVLKKWKVSLASETSAKRNRYGIISCYIFVVSEVLSGVIWGWHDLDIDQIGEKQLSGDAIFLINIRASGASFWLYPWCTGKKGGESRRAFFGEKSDLDIGQHNKDKTE